MASTTEQAAKLKEDGNRLYGLKDYAAAHGKYSKAISLDASNAVLYANRAACLFAMKKSAISMLSSVPSESSTSNLSLV